MDVLPECSQNISSPPPTETIIGKKRKRSASSHDDDDQPAVKYLELADIFTLDRFSDEVLFEIFKHLKTLDLLSLEKTCTRFCGIIQDHRLWNEINIISEEKSVHELKNTLKKATCRTKLIRINGLLGSTDRSIFKEQSECLMKYVVPKCCALEDLELQSVFIDFLNIKIEDFPRNLKRLIFRNVSVRWPDSAPTVFQKMDRKLIWLEELGIESCTWFHPYDIMLFSKCPSLKRLSMRGCKNLSDFVPYGSMASRFGFKSLEYLDVRDTPITDSDLQCFNAIGTLRELLLQCPDYLRSKKPDMKSPRPTSRMSYKYSPDSPTLDVINTSSDSSVSSASSASSDRSAELSPSSDGDANDGEPSTSRQRNRGGVSNVMMTIDLQSNTRTVILHGRVCEIPESDIRRIPLPEHPQGHLGSLLRHPHFWDMIDRQNGPDTAPCMPTKPVPCPITNRGISCFGRPANPIDQNVIWIRIGHRPSDNTFERLSLRHYKRITDDTLKHLMQCSPNLVYLDVSGSGVTQKGVNIFRARKPECEVICDHLSN